MLTNWSSKTNPKQQSNNPLQNSIKPTGMPKPTKTNTPPKKRRRGELRRANETRRVKDAQNSAPKLFPSKKQEIPPSELKAPNDERYSLKSPPALSLTNSGHCLGRKERDLLCFILK